MNKYTLIEIKKSYISTAHRFESFRDIELHIRDHYQKSELQLTDKATVYKVMAVGFNIVLGQYRPREFGKRVEFIYEQNRKITKKEKDRRPSESLLDSFDTFNL
jgi:hypothetical protein